MFLVAGIALLFFYRTSVVKHLVFYNSDTAEFGGVSLILDYATTDAERERGLGGRANVPYDYGMLFVFPREGKYGFWMKDMLVPVDIFWLDGKGQVIYMEIDVATSTFPTVFYPVQPATYVLETTAGFAQAHNIATGTPLILRNGLQSLPSITK